MNKEKNFLSSVIYLHDNQQNAVDFFNELDALLADRFEKYEYIVVDDACDEGTINRIKEWAQNRTCPLTIVHLSLYHGKESAMNAGLDAAIGDYIFEFDTAQNLFDINIVFQAYELALQGNDIVCVCPTHVKLSSRLFYKIFNRNSRSKYELQTDAFRLVSRRAINRVHASNSYMPYRKAAYAASGLKMVSLSFDGSVQDGSNGRMSLAIDSLALYTDAGFKLSIGITLFMMAAALFELIYTIVIYCIGKPIEGWTTMMLVMTFGFLGLFIILSIIIKYLSLNMDMIFRKQKYLVESVEKIQK